MMKDAILNFPKQFEFQPEVVNADKLKHSGKFLVCGMGGSHLAADLLSIVSPKTDIIIHSDYGLPNIPDLQDRLVILSSYSGNTEEVLEAYQSAKKRKLNMVVISVGGKLIEMAKQDNLPYVQMPNTGIQPRLALGFSILGLMKLMGLEDNIKEASKLVQKLDAAKLEKQGKELAGRFKDYVPVIYSSARNRAIAYNWKIKLNETGKIPAFFNVMPEMNHNEMNGFDIQDSVRHLSDKFYFIFLHDKEDCKKVQKRMEITEKLYADRGLKTEILELKGEVLEKIFNSLMLADWVAVYIAEIYGLESEQVPMIEEFKKRIEN